MGIIHVRMYVAISILIKNSQGLLKMVRPSKTASKYCMVLKMAGAKANTNLQQPSGLQLVKQKTDIKL